MKFSIYEGNMDRLKRKLTRIQNKCNRYGCPFICRKMGEHFAPTRTENGDIVIVKMIDIEVEGKAIINDWQFIGTVEHTENGNIITKVIDVEVPERYYTSRPYCEHCGVNRYRKYTYIVMNTETKEFKQVGKTCLKDFTCGMDAGLVTSWMNGITHLIEGNAPYQGCQIEPYYDIAEYLMNCKECCDIWGFKKANDSLCTYNRALENMMLLIRKPWFMTDDVYRGKLAELSEVNYNSSKHEKFVKDALIWIAEQSEDNNFLHNLKTACSLGYVKSRNLALVCALIPTYDRNIRFMAEQKEREKQRRRETEALKVSEHIGNVGERITVDVDSVKVLASWDNQWGTTWMYHIRDKNGNVLIWKASRWIFDNDGNFNHSKIIGTIKEHGEFREIKQTVITRCRIA